MCMHVSYAYGCSCGCACEGGLANVRMCVHECVRMCAYECEGAHVRVRVWALAGARAGMRARITRMHIILYMRSQ